MQLVNYQLRNEICLLLMDGTQECLEHGQPKTDAEKAEMEM